MHKAMFWEKGEQGRVVCELCPHNCHLKEGQLGICRARQNAQGALYSLNYGEVSGVGVDPIEKKPLKRFHPGSMVLSVGSFGCNFRCSYCQNWSISQERAETRRISPRELARLAQHYKASNSIGVAYTYSEPMIWYEYVLDSARQVKELGLLNVLVTNGYIEQEPLKLLLPFIDAINLDIKSYTEDFYRKLCCGSLDRVLENAALMAESCHLEVTTLLIPGHNDGESEIESLAKFLAGVNPDIPLHLTRYFPNYTMDLPPTTKNSLEQARQIAGKHLNYVYLGNV